MSRPGLNVAQGFSHGSSHRRCLRGDVPRTRSSVRRLRNRNDIDNLLFASVLVCCELLSRSVACSRLVSGLVSAPLHGRACRCTRNSTGRASCGRSVVKYKKMFVNNLHLTSVRTHRCIAVLTVECVPARNSFSFKGWRTRRDKGHPCTCLYIQYMLPLPPAQVYMGGMCVKSQVKSCQVLGMRVKSSTRKRRRIFQPIHTLLLHASI